MSLSSGTVFTILALIFLNIIVIVNYSTNQENLKDCESRASPLCPIVYCVGTPDPKCGTLPYRYDGTGAKVCLTPPISDAPPLS